MTTAHPIFAKGAETISSLDDWFRLALPERGAVQWKDGRSAKELARRWLELGYPPEVETLLETHPDTAGFRPERAEPEHPTPLDEFRRPRFHDLVVEGSAGARRLLLAIEGKADESFGPTVAAAASSPEPSRRPERVRRLLVALFGSSDLVEFGDLRYQLVHAVGGTVIEAGLRHAHGAVFIVHEFVSPSCQPENLARNQSDLDRFIARIDQDPGSYLVGPIAVPGGNRVPSDIPLYVGKATAIVSTA